MASPSVSTRTARATASGCGRSIEPLGWSGRAERGPAQSVLQTALRLAAQPFGRHREPTGLSVSGLSPRGGGDACGVELRAHRPRGPAWGSPALVPQFIRCARFHAHQNPLSPRKPGRAAADGLHRADVLHPRFRHLAERLADSFPEGGLRAEQLPGAVGDLRLLHRLHRDGPAVGGHPGAHRLQARHDRGAGRDGLGRAGLHSGGTLR
mmetsp:Transcript_4941/g.17804  ORF Transcript_4941/g.17804 Transcript_4941/m.17804 type:complete len:209 (-) Transcript_4941:286-912(-)